MMSVLNPGPDQWGKVDLKIEINKNKSTTGNPKKTKKTFTHRSLIEMLIVINQALHTTITYTIKFV